MSQKTITIYIHKEKEEQKDDPIPPELDKSEIKAYLNVQSITRNDFNDEPLDPTGNPVSSKCDLGIDGVFSEFKVLIGVFRQEENLCNDINNKTAKLALESKGFMKVTTVMDEESFTDQLPQYDCAWIISENQWVKGDQGKFLHAIQLHLGKQKGLMIWGDNDPFYFHANIILNQIDAGKGVKIKLIGNSPGNAVLTRGQLKKGMFISHQITTGILNMNEGVTIYHPVNCQTNTADNLGDYQKIGIGSSGLPAYICLEGTLNRGRIIVDCGWTKLSPGYWNGNWRYVRNCACWLLWMESRM